MMAVDLVGMRFGRLVVASPDGRYYNQTAWLCQCDCGKSKRVPKSSLVDGLTRSCGCLQREASKAANTKHGHSPWGRKRTVEYETWAAMISRCERPSHKDYPRYGGRGIRVHTKWRESFESFLSDVGPHPGGGLTLDRINNDGNYEPGNVRWASRKEQRANQERSVSRRE